MRILDILEAHSQSFRTGRCSCAEYGRKLSFEEHDSHVAGLLEKYMREREAEAWEEGWSTGWCDAWDNAKTTSTKVTTSNNPYKETE